MKISINGKTLELNQATVNNKTDVELAKLCADSDDPVVRELAYRLGGVHCWEPERVMNSHNQRAEINTGRVRVMEVYGTATGRFSGKKVN